MALHSALGLIALTALALVLSEARTAGMLLGTKTALNELIAHLDLSRLPDEALSARGR